MCPLDCSHPKTRLPSPSTKNALFYISCSFKNAFSNVAAADKMMNMRKNQSRTQTAYERLRADLLACRLQPGKQLRIDALCVALDVGSSAIREALSRLASEGFVISEPQIGFRVAPISLEEMRDLTRVRIIIEGLCLRSSIACGDNFWEAKLLAAHHLLSTTPERVADDPARTNDDFAKVHADFHEALVAACDSPWLLKIRANLFELTERYRRLSIPLAPSKRDLNKEHRDIMEAAQARDPDRAVLLMRDHLRATQSALMDAGLLSSPSFVGGATSEKATIEALFSDLIASTS